MGPDTNMLLELVDESLADKWEVHLKQVVQSLEQPLLSSDAKVAASQDAKVGSSSESIQRETDEDKKRLRDLSESARLKHYMLTHMLSSYTNIVQLQLCDQVPKAITARLLLETSQKIAERIDVTLGCGSVSAAVNSLMAASPQAAERLKQLEAEVMSLCECQRLVSHVKVGVATHATPTPEPASAALEVENVAPPSAPTLSQPSSFKPAPGSVPEDHPYSLNYKDKERVSRANVAAFESRPALTTVPM